MPHISEVEPGGGEKFDAGKALDVEYLEEVVGRLVEASVAPSTRKTYCRGRGDILVFVRVFTYLIYH